MEILAILPVAGRVAAGTAAAAGTVAEGGRVAGNLEYGKKIINMPDDQTRLSYTYLPVVGGMGCTPADLGPLDTGVAPGPVCSCLWKQIFQKLSFEDF